MFPRLPASTTFPRGFKLALNARCEGGSSPPILPRDVELLTTPGAHLEYKNLGDLNELEEITGISCYIHYYPNLKENNQIIAKFTN